MLTKQQIKDINRLKQKKYRNQAGLFVVEGIKSVKEFLKSDYKLYKLYATVDLFSTKDQNFEIVSDKELAKITYYKNPQIALGIFHTSNQLISKPEGFSLVLSDIRDPGNLGTLIRLSDWYGIKKIYCSEETVDCYNPKVVQASMGSLSRIDVFYTDLKSFLADQDLPVYGATMDGQSVYQLHLPEKALLVIGNEANGIHKNLIPYLTHLVSIPKFRSSLKTESLNAAMAGGILISEFRRNLITEM